MPEELEIILDRAAARGLSINELQRRARVGSSFFWRWKNGKLTPRKRSIDRILAVMEEV